LLLIPCALRYLGRGWTFDNLLENTVISEEVTRVFFHKFIKFGATVLYQKFVVAPSNAEEEAAGHTEEFKRAGLPACVGLTDATHILLEKVEHCLRESHLGFIPSHTSRTCNIIVNHRCHILATTTGHPACWNDKTLVLFDNFVVYLNEGCHLDNVSFELYESDHVGNIEKVKYQGAWLIDHNGYLNWPVTVPPLKTSISCHKIRFSQWLESIQKDVECTFGILKG
jgi:hypothetical protein